MTLLKLPIHSEVPYSPSFVLSFTEIDNSIRNVIDMVFLPGLNNPTIAVLFQTQQTWTSRLEEYKDTVSLRLITLDLVSRSYPVIASVDNLPYDSLKLAACPAAAGGVIVLCSNGIIHVDQAGKSVGVAVNGWAKRVSDFPFPPATRNEMLEGAQCAFVSDKAFLVVHRDGVIIPAELVSDGGKIGRIELGKTLAQTTAPSLALSVRDDLIFVGSIVGPSVLLNVQQVEVEVEGSGGAAGAAAREKKLAALAEDDPMESDEEDLYGEHAPAATGSSGVMTVAAETERVLRLSIADSLFAYGPIHDITFILGRNGVSHAYLPFPTD